MKYTVQLFLLALLLFSCRAEMEQEKSSKESLNILWLVAEDLSPYLPAFGDSTIQTPSLSRLAAEGVRYTNVYSVSGVCAPSRSAIATGMYPSSMGTHHMRTTKMTSEAVRIHGLFDYECVPPPQVKMVSELLRANGYYCTNNSKTDYQFRASKMAWDESSRYAHWRNRPEGKAFFSIFNFGMTHEGQIWAPAPLWNFAYDRDTFPPDRNQPNIRKRFKEGESRPLNLPDDIEVPIPPYLPNTEAVRKDVVRMYSNITHLDRAVGKLLNQLEEDGLLDKTIIVWYSDHGGPLPRQKRLLYDSGLKVPMIIRYPNQESAGEIDDQLISFVDFAPTLLSQANVPIPAHMQGQAFNGTFQAPKERQYIHAAADRFDECYDMIRAVRDKRFKYLRNFQPEKGYYLPLAYREQMASMQELLRLKKKGALDSIQMQWFRNSKPKEELFDTDNDPHELYNLAEDPAFAEKLTELREECERWMKATVDMGFIPEMELIESFWPNKIQPQTATPEIILNDGKTQLSCTTEGASIGYKRLDQASVSSGWKVYDTSFSLPITDSLIVIAHRIGYLPSDTLRLP